MVDHSPQLSDGFNLDAGVTPSHPHVRVHLPLSGVFSCMEGLLMARDDQWVEGIPGDRPSRQVVHLMALVGLHVALSHGGG